MKKLVSLALALVLALSVCAALADVTPSQVVGAWYLHSLTVNDVPYIMEGDYRVEFNRNKTAVLVMNGVERTFNWSISGDDVQLKSPEDANYDCNSYDLTLEDGLLKLETAKDFSVEGNSPYCDFVFGRDQVSVVLPTWNVQPQAEEDYFGVYVPYMLYDAKNSAYQILERDLMRVEISFAECKVTKDGEDYITLTDYDEAENALVLDESLAELLGYRGKAKLTAELSMEDGILSVNLSAEDTTLFHVFFNKLTEEEAAAQSTFQAIQSIVEALTNAGSDQPSEQPQE